MSDPLRHHTHDQSAFGDDAFGRAAERFARLFGTPRFIVGQTLIIIVWVTANAVWLTRGAHWDPYPFILLNLLFSTQAAYAAPLILLAQTRQADRDKATSEADARHRQEEADAQRAELGRNTQLTERIHELAVAIRAGQHRGGEPIGHTTDGGDW